MMFRLRQTMKTWARCSQPHLLGMGCWKVTLKRLCSLIQEHSCKATKPRLKHTPDKVKLCFPPFLTFMVLPFQRTSKPEYIPVHNHIVKCSFAVVNFCPFFCTNPVHLLHFHKNIQWISEHSHIRYSYRLKDKSPAIFLKPLLCLSRVLQLQASTIRAQLL